MLIAFQIAEQCRRDLLVAVTTIGFEDGSNRERNLAPALVWFDQDTRMLEIEIEVFEIAGMPDDRLALRAKVWGQISGALQPAAMLVNGGPVDAGVDRAGARASTGAVTARIRAAR